MRNGIRSGVLAALVGGVVALSGAGAAIAAPAGAAAPPLSVTATDIRYGQPDLDGRRWATNTVTYTNRTAATIDHPVLTFLRNGRDVAAHADWRGCPAIQGSADRIVCFGHPVEPGASATVQARWYTTAEPRPGVARVTVEQGLDRDGAVVPGTARHATWRVSFERLTGTFGITATDLAYGSLEADGYRRGSTTVTIRNLTRQTVAYPLVTFPSSAGGADHTLWSDCTTVFGRPGQVSCLTEPLAPGASRTLTFGFLADSLPGWDFDANVRVDAADAEGTVVEGTAAGTRYRVIFGDR